MEGTIKFNSIQFNRAPPNGRKTYSFGPLQRANLNQWTIHLILTTAIKIHETRPCQREITGKYGVIIVIKHEQI
jgi:hypothetical protein